MNLKNLFIRRQATLAVAMASALVVSVSATAAGNSAVPHKAGPIKSGAGPGWPATLKPSDFVAHVTNPWFPLKPGSKYRYRGRKGHTKSIDAMRVTHRTKRIEGVKTTVVHDVVRIHHRAEEVTNDFYAQDRHGNVWYFGEATKELDRHGNTISTEGSFISGKKGARPGVLVPGRPKVGLSARQEFLKGQAEDHFKVLDLNARVSVPFVSSRHALRTKEWTPLEPKVLDNKYYVPGIGSVREIAVKGPTEVLRLVSFKKG
jgi:hypothetical protein